MKGLDQLAGCKRPKVIHIMPALPRSGIGKISRRLIRDRLFAVRTN